MSSSRLAPQRTPDTFLASLVLGLASFGVVVSSSARVFVEAKGSGQPLGLIVSLVHLAAGVAALVLATLVNYRRLVRSHMAWLLLAATCALLVAVLFMPPIAGTNRFMRVAGISLQPSELAKPVLVLLLATSLARVGDEIRSRGGLFRPLMIAGVLASLVLAGRDLGTPILMGAVTLAMVGAAGARIKDGVALVGGMGALATIFTLVEDYRVDRVRHYLAGLLFDPDTLDATSYQLRQSFIALGSGGTLGKGLGGSSQKAFFLPEAHNDFIFAIVGEELGLVGALVVLGAFLAIAWRGLVIAERCRDETGRLVALGATWMLVGQALCHMAVVTGLLPTKGLTLPFLSAGGSAMISSFLLAGLILNVSIHADASFDLDREEHGDA
jgi:cell division protein FtsW